MSTFTEHKSIADRSATDRSRHKKKIDKALKEGIRDIVADESIIGQDGNKKVRIPVKGIKEYQFIYGDNSKKVGGAQGKDIRRGQKIADSKQKGKPGQGDKAGNESGEEYYEVEITLEELAEHLFADLELPDLERKKFKFISSESYRRKGHRPYGIRPRLSKKETLKNKIRRKKIAQKAGTYDEDERFTFHESDLKYKHFQNQPVEISSAVIFFIMDVSGSMSTEKKYIARSFFFLLYQFLKHKYDNVEVVFVAHTVEAKEVSEEDFFSLSPSGGTFISPALDLTLDVIEKRYHPSNWNIYAFHCSDGDNWSEDEDRAIKSSVALKEKCQLYGYCEIDPDGRSSSWRQSPHSRTFESYKPHEDDKFKLLLLNSSKDIWPTFKNIFGGRKEWQQ